MTKNPKKTKETKKIKKTRIKLTTEEAKRVRVVAEVLVDRIICGETLRLTLPIVRLMGERAISEYKRIEHKYGEVI